MSFIYIYIYFIALSLLLTTRNHFCKVEVARVFGNLTRSAAVRNYLLETGGESIKCIYLHLDVHREKSRGRDKL